MSPAGRFVVGCDHPSLPGHFPGRPIVPGVVVLDEAIALILQRLPATRVAGLAQVKFLTPVLPEHVVEVAYDQNGTDRVSFACNVDGTPVVRGSLRLDPEADPGTAP